MEVLMVRALKLIAAFAGVLLATYPTTAEAFIKHKAQATDIRPSGRIYLRPFQYGAGPRYGYGWWGPKYAIDPSAPRKHHKPFNKIF
jgi:hypothetical protein